MRNTIQKILPYGIALIALAGFIVVASLVMQGRTQQFNAQVYGQIANWIRPSRTAWLTVVTNLGEWYVFVPVTLIFLVVPKTRVTIGFPLAIVLAAGALLNAVLKVIFAVERPNIARLVQVSGYSFPSGHAMNGLIFLGFLAFLLMCNTHSKALQIIMPAGAALLILTIGFSRVYLGVHYTTDVMGGYLAGLFMLSLAIGFVNWVRGRRRWKIKPM